VQHQAGPGEHRGELAQLGLVLDRERDRVGAAVEISGRRVAGGVDQLSGLDSVREIRADDAVVRQVGCGEVVNATWPGF
jgi:hypothetical protein